jgi:tRNA threonylcarbamoyl adenosine modification protein (Sua5/YciO/YrdC/YwlC family)
VKFDGSRSTPDLYSRLTSCLAAGIHVGLEMILEIDPTEPEPWLLARAEQVLRDGGVVVMPTDTVYGMACGITHPEAIRRIYRLKDMDPKKPLSILVSDMTMVGRYARGVSNPAFRLLKRVLPGPYTFIFRASPDVPKVMLRKRRTIGIRMPDNPIVLALLDELGEPLLSSSIRGPEQDFTNDPEEIDAALGDDVDMVIDGGILLPVPSTVVDLSGSEPILLREGKGDVETLELF